MKTSLIIWYAIVQHILWGFLLLIDSSPLNITAIHAMSLFQDNNVIIGLMFIMVAICALISMFFDEGWFNFMLLVPQQIAIVFSAMGAATAIKLSSFADGVVRPWPFICADQSGYILLAVFHTLAIIVVFYKATWTRSRLQ